MNQRPTLKVNDDGILEIGGITCEKLAKDFGTPLYVMDQTHIENMCSIFRDTLQNEYGEGMIAYASKAFCCKGIYKIIDKMNLGADAVSGGELFTAYSANFPMDKMIFHGNNKTYSELKLALELGVGYVVIDAYSEADQLDQLCSTLNKKQKVLIRVNPGVEAHTHHFIQTAKIDSKFGFSIASGEAEAIINHVKNKTNLILEGLHCHIGSQIFEEKSFVLAVEKMTDFYKKLNENYGIEFNVLNLGGGFGIWYSENDSLKSVEEYANFIKLIANTLKNCIKNKAIKKPFLILEPGRAVVGEAGITLYTAGRIKEINNVKNYISIDGGMFENPRYALYQAKYTVVAPNKMNLEKNKVYSIAGKCCESGDIIAEDCALPQIEEGDLLAVLSTGAYNYSMASNYNRNLIPPVIMVKNGRADYVIKPQTYQDLIKNDL